jgi:acyl carrier protein
MAMSPQNREKLQTIFRTVFQLAPSADASAVTQQDEPRWDSLAHVTLVAALENEFDVQLTTSDALQLRSYAVAERLLEDKGI